MKVDPRAQKPDQKRSLQEHFVQNAAVRISALDANQKTRYVFTGVILNVENDNKANIVGYNVNREITQTLAKPERTSHENQKGRPMN